MERLMTETGMAAVARLRTGDEASAGWLREAVSGMVQELMQAEVRAPIGADRYDRIEAQTTQCNGYQSRVWDTRVGSMDLASP